MRTTPQTLRDDFEKLFDCHIEGEFISNKLSLEQLWLIVKLSKYVRLRASNNAAFNNLFNQVFPYAKFQEVMKTKVVRPKEETGLEKDIVTSYKGLKITTVDGKELSQDEGEE